MKQKTRSRIRTTVLFLTCLAVLVMVNGNQATRVRATTCTEAWDNWLSAEWGYMSARWSYFYGSPESCDSQCGHFLPHDPTGFADCVSACNADRLAALGAAEVTMFSAAEMTCEPLQVDECDHAQLTYEACLNTFIYAEWQSPEEFDAVMATYTACVTASKIDRCR